MRRLLIKILICILAITACFGLVACKNTEWKGTSMKNAGNVISNGGFIAETENYLYYINGFSSYGEDNTFGTPVKGALMAVEKSSIKSGNLKTEIVVPKLFVANDYKAGVFIYNGYVYYGTPSTDKNNAGDIARSEMTFTKTKLDGTGTEALFTVSSHSYEYRFVESNGVVYLVYYNVDETSLNCYNTSTKKNTVIAKTDYKTKGKFESLDKYKFVDADKMGDVVVFYTATVYSEDYYEQAASKDGYARGTALYNKMYAYKVGDTVASGNEFAGTLVKTGKDTDCSFVIKSIQYGESANYLIYEETNLKNEMTYYALDLTKLAEQGAAQKIVNDQYLQEDFLFVSLNEIYYALLEGQEESTTEGEEEKEGRIFIARTSLIEKDYEVRIKCAELDSIPSFITKKVEGEDTYIYYYDKANNIVKIKIAISNDLTTEFTADPIRISEGSVAAAWYAPEFVTIDGEEYLFYCDNTAKAASYIKYLKLTGAEVKKEAIEDSEDMLYYLEGHKFLSKISNTDSANIAKVDLNAVGIISWDAEEQKLLYKEEIQAARAAYNALSSEAKEAYGEESLEKLENAEKALKIAEKLKNLEGIINYEICSAEQKTAYQTAYNSVKSDMASIKDDSSVLDLLDNNMKYNFYVKATELFS